jgi:3-oxoacyl-[acyl-carrier-protein] synthase-3
MMVNNFSNINKTVFIEMAGNEVFKIAVNRLSSLAQDTLKACNMGADELDWMVPQSAECLFLRCLLE